MHQETLQKVTSTPPLGKVLITGSEGLIGTALRSALVAQGVDVLGLDCRADGPDRGDTRDAQRVFDAVSGCDGVVHLAAVSRVAWGEQQPARCWDTNVGGTGHVIEAVQAQDRPPWLLFASSREVYGQPRTLPVREDAELSPMNVYGRSKAEGERLVAEAQRGGLCTAIVRYSNVYGRVTDHSDRVVPAFAKAAAVGGTIRVDGPEHTFDFTHIDDAVRGTSALIGKLATAASQPPIHLVTGQPVTLSRLAQIAADSADKPLRVVEGRPRKYDVSSFYGDTERSKSLLGWEANISIFEGMRQLIEDFSELLLE